MNVPFIIVIVISVLINIFLTENYGTTGFFVGLVIAALLGLAFRMFVRSEHS